MSHKSKTFTWTSPDDVKITLPAMGSIKTGVLRKHRKEEPVDFVFSLLEGVGDEETIAKIDDLTTGEFNELWEAWQKDGETSAGESSRSST